MTEYQMEMVLKDNDRGGCAEAIERYMRDDNEQDGCIECYKVFAR